MQDEQPARTTQERLLALKQQSAGAYRNPRAILIVLDSVGVGELPDAHKYGDEGANTLGNTARAAGGLHLPVLGSFGIGCLTEVQGVPCADKPVAHAMRAAEAGCQKDTVAGHWELMGCSLYEPFPTFPDGFPQELREKFNQVMGVDWLGGMPASGTTIIAELGEEHLASRKPICYTSADSVFQVAVHTDVMSESELHAFCERVREEVCTGPYAVARIIARPFAGEPGSFYRTSGRKDFALKPVSPTLFDVLAEHHIPIHGVGKIGDIFAWHHINESPHTANNQEGFDTLLSAVKKPSPAGDGFIFCNLNDFDMLWGHRNNADGYAQGLEAVDRRLPELLNELIVGDLLIICADHGCDPTDVSTDHTREYVPVLAQVIGGSAGQIHEDLPTFSCVGKTIGEYFGVTSPGPGTSFLARLI